MERSGADLPGRTAGPHHVRRRPVLVFLLLTFTGSWSIPFIYLLLGGKWVLPQVLEVGVSYMLIPLAAAFLVQKLVLKEPFRALGMGFSFGPWYLAAYLLPFAAALSALGIGLLLPGVVFDPAMEGFFRRMAAALSPEKVRELRESARALPFHPFWLTLLQGLVMGPTVNALAAFGEEAGWRGLLQRELSPLGFWPASLFIGFVWGLWHAPLILLGINYPGHPVAGVFLMVLFTLLLTPPLMVLRLRTGSVLAPAVFHGCINAAVGLPLVVSSGSDLLLGLTGLSGFLALILLNIGLFLQDRFISREPVISRRT